MVPYRQATQHRSCRGNKRGPQQATTAKPKGATTRVADFTAVPPLPPIDIDNQQHRCLLLFAEALMSGSSSIATEPQQKQHKNEHGAASSITDCVVPNPICVPQLFASSTPGTQLEIIRIPGKQTAATSNRRAAAAAVLGFEMPMDNLRWVALGHVKATLVRACIDMTCK